MTYGAALGTSAAGRLNHVTDLYDPWGQLWRPDSFSSSTGNMPAITTSVARIGMYSGTLADGVVAYFLNSYIIYTDHRPTTFTNNGMSFSVGDGTQAYDSDTSTYTQVNTTSSTTAGSNIVYSGIASGSSSGQLMIKYRLAGDQVDNDDGTSAKAEASGEYSTDGGSTWTQFAYCAPNADTGVALFVSNIISVSLSNIRVRFNTETRRLSVPITIAKSQALAYDITFSGT